MTKRAVVTLAILGIVGIGSTAAARRRDTLVSFAGGIGVIPVQNVAGAMNGDGTFQDVRRNVVRNVNPGGGPWRIADLKATIDVDGRIQVKGRGLLLASGNSIGQNANQVVFATLICEPALPFFEHNTNPAGVPLAPNGDFRIDDVLDSVPSECPSPVLLIRTTSNGTWFAAGVRDFGDDD